jgi:hypothetical protein
MTVREAGRLGIKKAAQKSGEATAGNSTGQTPKTDTVLPGSVLASSFA